MNESTSPSRAERHKMKRKNNVIGIDGMVRAMQLYGFEHDEIMSMRQAMVTGDFSKIQFESN